MTSTCELKDAYDQCVLSLHSTLCAANYPIDLFLIYDLLHSTLCAAAHPCADSGEVGATGIATEAVVVTGTGIVAAADAEAAVAAGTAIAVKCPLLLRQQ